MTETLPFYERSPVNEVVIGVQFLTLDDFRIAHVGQYWETIRNRYPSIDDQVPIAHLIEKGTEAPPEIQTPQALLGIAMPWPRVWFIDPTDAELIQLQRDRFLRNWRRRREVIKSRQHRILSLRNHWAWLPHLPNVNGRIASETMPSGLQLWRLHQAVQVLSQCLRGVLVDRPS